MPKWVTQSLTTEQRYVGFDVAAYGRLTDAYVARASGPFSWSGRGGIDPLSDGVFFLLSLRHVFAMRWRYCVDILSGA